MPMTKEQGIKNARNGEAFEWRQLRKMRSSALEICRSAGSRSIFDIWSIQKDKLRLVQCKANGYLDPAEREIISKFLQEKPDWVQVEIHVRLSPKITKKFIIQKAADLERFAKRTINTEDENLCKSL